MIFVFSVFHLSQTVTINLCRWWTRCKFAINQSKSAQASLIFYALWRHDAKLNIRLTNPTIGVDLSAQNQIWRWKWVLTGCCNISLYLFASQITGFSPTQFEKYIFMQLLLLHANCKWISLWLEKRHGSSGRLRTTLVCKAQPLVPEDFVSNRSLNHSRRKEADGAMMCFTGWENLLFIWRWIDSFLTST